MGLPVLKLMIAMTCLRAGRLLSGPGVPGLKLPNWVPVSVFCHFRFGAVTNVIDERDLAARVVRVAAVIAVEKNANGA